MTKTKAEILDILGAKDGKALTDSMRRHNLGKLVMGRGTMLSHGKQVVVIRDILTFDIEVAIEHYETCSADVLARQAGTSHNRTVWVDRWAITVNLLNRLLKAK